MLQLSHLYKTLVMIIDNIIKLCHTTKYKNIRHKSEKNRTGIHQRHQLFIATQIYMWTIITDYNISLSDPE